MLACSASSCAASCIRPLRARGVWQAWSRPPWRSWHAVALLWRWASAASGRRRAWRRSARTSRTAWSPSTSGRPRPWRPPSRACPRSSSKARCSAPRTSPARSRLDRPGCGAAWCVVGRSPLLVHGIVTEEALPHSCSVLRRRLWTAVRCTCAAAATALPSGVRCCSHAAARSLAPRRQGGLHAARTRAARPGGALAGPGRHRRTGAAHCALVGLSRCAHSRRDLRISTTGPQWVVQLCERTCHAHISLWHSTGPGARHLMLLGRSGRVLPQPGNRPQDWASAVAVAACDAASVADMQHAASHSKVHGAHPRQL